MSDSIKETITKFLEARLRTIIEGGTVVTHTYTNTISYVDRQYYQFTEEDVLKQPMPWLILNCEGEDFSPQPSRRYDNTILYQMVGFVQATKESPNLDSMMNSLQKDILVAMLTDVNLSGLASWITIRGIVTVSEMIWPYGGFIISLEVNYSFTGASV